MVYNKPAITVNAQLRQLKARGLSISSHADAKHYLRQVGYYRLAGYWWTMQHDPRRHLFRRGSSFAQVIERYNFDRELRLICLNMIERIEVGLRTQMIYHLSLAYTPYWFEDNTYAKNNHHWQQNLNKLGREVTRSSERFILEHQRKYHSDTRNPPAWKSMEVITLGLLSKMYRNLDDVLPEKTDIAHKLQLPDKETLENWLHAIALVRNVSAHHCRLFQRSMEIWPTMPVGLTGPWINTRGVDSKSIYAHLSCMQYLLQTISPNNRFPDRLKQLFIDYPSVRFRQVGFPANWKSQPLWQ